MDIPSSADIVIIGGGVMGASTAYHLASLGQKNIVLVEKEEFFGLGATGRCAGGVRYQFATEINILLSQKSLPMFESFADEIGQPVDYRQCGYLFVLTRADDVRKFQSNIHLQNKLGVNTQWLTGDEIRGLLPDMVFDDALGGTLNPKDGLVDPNGVVMGYISAAQRLGVTALTGVETTGIMVQNGRVTAIETNKGRISTGTIVNAAGPWAGLIGKMAGIEIPIIPLRRQMFTTTPIPEIPADFPFVIDFAQSLYFHREGEGLLIGMSNPNETPGFSQMVDDQFELVNLEAAIRRMPLVEQAGLVSHWAGLYEVTPDAHPIYGGTPVEGFFIVGGFSGHGFMHGPISGKLMAEKLMTGQFRSLDVTCLDLARFKEGRLITEYNVV
ncbi:MAG: FAD-binding oxidoreductase [Chloroflexota bacterium]